MLVVTHTISLLLCLPFTNAEKILLIGSSNSMKPNEEPPFKLDDISANLREFGLDVVVEDVHTSTNLDILAGSGSSVWADMPHYLFSLAQYMFWPDGKAQRDNLLQGKSSQGQWDFVVLLHDPYILSRMPGYFAEGVNMVSKEIKAGGATPLLFMQWPGPSSSVDLNSFVDITYRVGAGAGVRVIPGAEAWRSFGSSDVSGEHPTPNGALIAAAAIYGEISGKSGANKLSKAADKAMADDVFNLVDQGRCENHVSGAFSMATPFSMSGSSRTGQIKMCHTGSSSERGITGGLKRVVATYDGASVSQQGCTADGLDFNIGRGNTNFEANKQYKLGDYPFSFGFPMQERKDGSIITYPYGLDHRRWQANDLDICQNMIEKDEVSLGARCVPLRLMYNKMKKEDSGVRTHRDNWHMSTELDNAAGAYIYTIASRQACKQGDEPSEKYTDAWRLWLGFRVGCETAWRLATLTDDSGSDLSPSCGAPTTAAPTTAAPTTAAPTTAAPTTAAPTTAAPTTAAPTTAAPTTAAPTTAAPTTAAPTTAAPTEFYFGTSKPSSASAGTFLDDGKGFSSRDGKRYGWDCNGDANVNYASGRRAPGRRDGGLGLNHFDRFNTCREGSTYLPVNWNLEVPNGNYDLEVDFMVSYKAGCKVMGQSAGCGSGKCEVRKKNIKVVNGKITVTGYGHNSRKCHSISRVKVVPLSPGLDLVSMPTIKKHKKHNDGQAQVQVSSDGSIHHTKFSRHMHMHMHMHEEPEPTASGE